MFKNIINETFPDIKINEFEILGKGKAGTICLVNKEIIFKIPLPTEHSDIKTEAKILKFLENKLNIQIPKIIYADYSRSGLYIIGETLLNGVTYSYELHDSFHKKTQIDILRQLGQIVRDLHNVNINDLPCQVSDTLDDIINEYNERLLKVYSLFSNTEIQKLKEIAENYKHITINHPVAPVLCHHDLHFFNIMFDIKNKRISGLLDFGCAGLSEPARDWHYYFDAKHVLEGYGNNGDIYFLQRQQFHALSWLLNNLGEGMEESLGYIRDYM